MCVGVAKNGCFSAGRWGLRFRCVCHVGVDRPVAETSQQVTPAARAPHARALMNTVGRGIPTSGRQSGGNLQLALSDLAPQSGNARPQINYGRLATTMIGLFTPLQRFIHHARGRICREDSA